MEGRQYGTGKRNPNPDDDILVLIFKEKINKIIIINQNKRRNEKTCLKGIQRSRKCVEINTRSIQVVANRI
jgi:hypothetical protein